MQYRNEKKGILLCQIGAVCAKGWGDGYLHHCSNVKIHFNKIGKKMCIM